MKITTIKITTLPYPKLKLGTVYMEVYVSDMPDHPKHSQIIKLI